MNAALLQAEQTVAVGPLAGPILHLRQRGDAARFSAMVFLFALVLAVLSGLAFYLGLPFWKQFVDGRRGTLDESIAATEQVMRTLDGEREGQRTALVEALRQVGERIVLPELQQPSFKGVVSLGFDSALAFGSGGTLISWTRAGGLVPDNSKEFRIFANIKDALAIDSDTALLFGDESEVLRWSRYGGLQREQTSLSLGFTNINGGIALGPDSALIFGTGGIANATAVRWTRLRTH